MPVAAGAKQRFADDKVRISTVIGEVAGRDVIVLDDEIAKGSTVIELLDRLRERGAAVDPGRLHARPVHRPERWTRLQAQEDVLEIVSTNTVPIPDEKRVPKLKVLSVAPALAEAMRRINIGESVSTLFEAP